MEKTRRTHVQGGNLDQTDNGVAGSAYLLRAARRSSGCTRATFAPNCSEVAFRPSNTGSQHRRLSEDGFVPTVLVNAFRRMKLLGASIHGKQGPARKTLNTEGFLAEIHTDRIGVPAPFPASLPLQPPRSESGNRGPFRSRDPSYSPEATQALHRLLAIEDKVPRQANVQSRAKHGILRQKQPSKAPSLLDLIGLFSFGLEYGAPAPPHPTRSGPRRSERPLERNTA